ncbi:glycosyltransferase family 2 protein [Desulfosudis oleivorans]|uniref:Ribonuclease III n=1 Tax=Desulfosudis oleivorans (strain DSM 6200 / JCM 39069 / Hxd3) TaxID=96561 RepID=A8ZW33_DESOH|nr:glycosyltransferase family 2 protein [Desulfosudis oleivorans]ABW68267.1 Ribonuclease III [Desulfosudis oleivorans Hxd3]
MPEKTPLVSVIVPVWNDGPCVGRAADRIHTVLKRTCASYEVIFVDDGSSDNSFEEICRACAAHAHTMGIRLARHAGQHAALRAGLAKASGEVLVNFDVDMQGVPEDIPRLVEKVGEGFDLVCGWRTERREAWHRRVFSFFLNRWVNRHTGRFLHDNGCFKAINRKVADRIGQNDSSRFLTALVPALADRVTEVPVSWRKREQGRSRYALRETASMVLDFFLVYPVLPFVWFFWGGLTVLMAGGAVLGIGLCRLTDSGYWQPSWLTWTGGALLALGGMLFAVWTWAHRGIHRRKKISNVSLLLIERIVGKTDGNNG